MLLKPDECRGCPLDSKFGHVPASGDGDVLIVLEAAGKDEAEAGVPVVGRAGYFFFNQLRKIGLEREQFTIHNVLSCRPPNNKLAGMPYEQEAIAHCSPQLDATLSAYIKRCEDRSITPSILSLGRISFKRLTGLTEGMGPLQPKMSYLNYPFRLDNGAVVVAAHHPAFLMRGKQNLIPTMLFAAQRACEISQTPNYILEQPQHLLDPNPYTFGSWVDDYERAFRADPSIPLAFDIETAFKTGRDEEEVSKEDDPSQEIFRISFCYEPLKAVSIPWSASYLPQIERIFAIPSIKVGWNNENYDDPRVAAQMPLKGTHLDAMLAWHVLHSALPKGLGFVAPFYCPDAPMWKHLNDDKPAYYNAVDSDVTLRCWLGIVKDLKSQGLWDVFERHVVKLNRVLAYMRMKGVKRDENVRAEAERLLSGKLDGIYANIQAAVPTEALQLKVYKRTPDDTSGMRQVPGILTTKRCPNCGKEDVLAAHYKSIGKKRLSQGEAENPCFGHKSEKVEVERPLWARPLPFKISKTSLARYQEHAGHTAIYDDKAGRVTYDKSAIQTLATRYPDDPLYPLLGGYRDCQKLLGTYVGITVDGKVQGGMPIGRDGRVHTLFTHNPSTLRLASQNPNLQNLPRPAGPDDPATLIRKMIIADEGMTLVANDFSGIEALLVGYEARSPEYMRLTKIDVHSFYTAFCLNSQDPGKFHSSDLPSLEWDDDKLRSRLREIKATFKWERNTIYKHLVHAANFGQEAKGAAAKIYKETGVLHPTTVIQGVMNVYRELFPAIPAWHRTVKSRADKEGYLRNAFGYRHSFTRVLDKKLIGGRWQSSNGPDASKVLAFLPQSNAAGIIKEALLRCFRRFDEIGQWLRLTVHDEILCECPTGLAERVFAVLREEMEQPIKQLPLDPSWDMGDYLTVDTEGKAGPAWSEMD